MVGRPVDIGYQRGHLFFELVDPRILGLFYLDQLRHLTLQLIDMHLVLLLTFFQSAELALGLFLQILIPVHHIEMFVNQFLIVALFFIELLLERLLFLFRVVKFVSE